MNATSLNRISFGFVYFVLSIFVFITNQNLYLSLAFTLETSTVSSFFTNTNASIITQTTSKYLDTTSSIDYSTGVTQTYFSETTTFDHTKALSITNSTLVPSIRASDTKPTTLSFFNEKTTSEPIMNLPHTSSLKIETKTSPFSSILLNNSSDDTDNSIINLETNSTKDQNQTLNKTNANDQSDNDLGSLVVNKINETFENSTTPLLDISISSQTSTSYETFLTNQTTLHTTTITTITTTKFSTSQGDIYNNDITITHQNTTSGVYITTRDQTFVATSSPTTYTTKQVTNSSEVNQTLTSRQLLFNGTFQEKLEEDRTPVIVGAAVGAVLFLVLIGLLVMFYCIMVSRKATGRYNPKKEEEGGVVDGGLHFDILQLPIEEKLI